MVVLRSCKRSRELYEWSALFHITTPKNLFKFTSIYCRPNNSKQSIHVYVVQTVDYILGNILLRSCMHVHGGHVHLCISITRLFKLLHGLKQKTKHYNWCFSDFLVPINLMTLHTEHSFCCKSAIRICWYVLMNNLRK